MISTGNFGFECRSRRGLISVMMLIGLMIVGIIAASLIKAAVARRLAAKVAERQLQADALADSGLDRALQRLAANPKYSGETWEIPADDLGGRGRATIQIDIHRTPGRPDQRQMVVVADYVLTQPGPFRRSRTLDLPDPPAPR